MTTGVFDVRDFGAKGDNAADDTASIQNAIDAAAALPSGGTVIVPPGQYYCSGIKLKTQVTVSGYGPASIIRLLPSVTTALIALATPGTNHTVLRDLRLRGNKYGGAGGLTAHGIDYVTAEETDGVRANELYKFHGDAQHRIFHLTCDAFSGHGMRLFTRECHVDHCHISDCGNDGLRLEGSDNWISNTSINWVGRRGVTLTGGGNLFSGVKTWFIGTDPAYQEGDGFHVVSGRNRFVGCEAQDVSRYGWNLFGGDSNVLSGCAMENIGNLYKRANLGYNHPILRGALYLFRGSGSFSNYNRAEFTYTMRGNISNIESFVAFSNGANNNVANVCGSVDMLETNAPIFRAANVDTYNNVAWFNNQIA